MAAALFGLLLTGIFTQYFEINVGLAFPAEHTLALPAIWAFILILMIGAFSFLLTRSRLLERAELLLVMWIMLLAAPLMTQGFWHRIVAILATNPRTGDLEKLDLFSDRLWPHGPNLLENALAEVNRTQVAVSGSVSWEELEYEAGQRGRLPVLVNEGKDDVAWIRVKLPVEQAGTPVIVPGEAFIASVLARAEALGPNAYYYCRAYPDDATPFVEFFRSSAGPRNTYQHRTGFQRVGAYGVKFPPATRESVTLEFGLSGRGRLALHDAKLLNVAVIEGVYKGRKVVTESQYRELAPGQRANLVVRPDRLCSLAGVKYLTCGAIPVREWAAPVLLWTAFIAMLLLATLAVNILMRKQWLESERFQMPVARIPVAMMDDMECGGSTPLSGSREANAEESALPPLWRNRLMWTGAALSLAWMLMKAWHSFNPKVPDLALSVPLQPYFADPGWGEFWSHCRFEVDAIFLALCMFMELNVLLSLVLGYFLFRSQFVLGHATGLTTNPNYPYPFHQTVGAYLAYAAVLVFFTRRYLWGVLKAAMRNDRAASDGEALSYRAALILLLLTGGGSVVWARWMGISGPGMLCFFVFLVTIGFVASRLRTECGAPWGYYVPWNLPVFLALLGGITVFGPEMILFAYVAGFMLAPTVFFQIPGAQMELLELGRRWRVQPWHLVAAAGLGILGGMLVGGWVFLSNAYAVGGESTRYLWAFDPKGWCFFAFNQDYTRATQEVLGQAGGPAQTGLDPAWLAAGLAALATVVVTALRQLLAGFWFHPIGVVLGGTNFMEYIWGSALAAWAIRGLVVKLGGAATVKNKLQPFFIGVFLGAAVAYLLIGIHGGYWVAQGTGGPAPTLSPP